MTGSKVKDEKEISSENVEILIFTWDEGPMIVGCPIEVKRTFITEISGGLGFDGLESPLLVPVTVFLYPMETILPAT